MCSLHCLFTLSAKGSCLSGKRKRDGAIAASEDLIELYGKNIAEKILNKAKKIKKILAYAELLAPI